MLSQLRAIWMRLVGGGGSAGVEAPSADAVEYRGYRIRPAPYRTNGQYQTAGVIEKEFPSGPREHRFVRAETHASRDEAEAFALAKAKQIIDEQGDRIFPGG